MISPSGACTICTRSWSGNKLALVPASRLSGTQRSWNCRFCPLNRGQKSSASLWLANSQRNREVALLSAMKILVIGSGGREHALAWKLRQSPHAGRIFCTPGNAGTAEVGENVAIPASDLHALVDGKNYLLLESARDHKRVSEGDQGPNTGGMGAFSPANNWNSKLEAQFDTEIMKPLLRGLIEEGVTFRGLLYPGLIITSDGPRVLEFNCRFGDPETQALLPRMKSDLLPLLEATIDGKIERCTIEWDTRAAVTVVLASGGYPGKYESGKSISGLDQAARLDDVQVFHAGTKRDSNEIRTAGGRVLAVTALGSTLEAARARAYEAVSRIHFENCHYRRDIALGVIN